MMVVIINITSMRRGVTYVYWCTNGGDELRSIYLYTINENNITERMRRSNTVHIIAGKETKTKLTSIGNAQPVVYRWSGWVTTNNETVRMNAVNREPMISLKGTTFPSGL